MAKADVSRILTGDFNGDGITDIYRVNGWGTVEADSIWLFQKDGSFAAPILGPSTSVNGGVGVAAIDTQTDVARVKIADFNGDGLSDVYRVNGWGSAAADSLWLFNPDGTFTQKAGPETFVQADTDTGSADVSRIKLGDFNGDGIIDVYRVNGWGTSAADYIWLFDSTGAFKFRSGPTTFVNSSPATASSDISRVKFGDLNGDGITDMYRVNGWGTAPADDIYLFKGDGSFDPMKGPQTWVNDGDTNSSIDISRIMLVDVNSDGVTDVYRVNGWGTYSKDSIWLMRGDGSFESVDGPATTVSSDTNLAPSDIARLIPGDFNGDGVTDIYKVKGWGTTEPDHILFGQTKINRINAFYALLSAGQYNRIEINYKPLTDSTVYTPSTQTLAYPERHVRGPMYVVSSVVSDDGIGGSTVTSYYYQGLKAHARGRGLLGFEARSVVDEQKGIKSTEWMRQDYPFIGSVSRTETRIVATDQLLSDTDITYTYRGVIGTDPLFVFAPQSVERSFDLNTAGLLTTKTTTSDFDAHGCATTVSIDTLEGQLPNRSFNQTTVNQYTADDEALWHLCRLTRSSATSQAGVDSLTRTSAFEYDPVTGVLNKEIVEPDTPALTLTTSYGFDAFGNKTSATVSGIDITTRSSSTTYDARGQFPVTVTNALGQSETHVYDARFGVMTRLTGPNQLTTQWEYDGIGRKIRELRADGTESNVSYEWCNGLCPDARALYKVSTTATASTTSTAYFDKLGREVLVETQGFAGETIYVEKHYDANGQVAKTSRPYFAGATPIWMLTTYDILNRPIRQDSPATGTALSDYQGFSVIVTNDLGQTTTETKNGLGQTVTIKDHLNNLATYSHDPLGNLVAVTDAAGNTVTNTYDQLGRKIAMSDPDLGAWTYQYNVLGQLVSQTDAKTQTVSMTYDLLGRMVSRTEAEGTTTWTYGDDPLAKNVGKLISESQTGFSRSYGYDALGRPITVDTQIGATAYATATSYDAYGRVDTVTYPGGFQAQNTYTALGFLHSVRDPVTTTQVYWEAQAADAEGHLIMERLGNGILTLRDYENHSGRLSYVSSGLGGSSAVQDLTYTYDSLGNLTSRADANQGLSETFAYDGLNRLTGATLVGVGVKTYAYDALGNITSKSDLGTYAYDDPAHVHAVTTAAGIAYTYDVNGNMTGGDGRTITWSSYNKPVQISKGSITRGFSYGPDRARYRQSWTDGAASKTTTYIGGLYEEIDDGSLVEKKHYIRAGSKVIAVYTAFSSGAEKTRYLHRDHLGSVDVITDEAGALVERLSFAPYGKRRQANWQDALTPISSELNRGYTGHEQLDDLGLIHMNGRVYDPGLGRFLSADPIVQAPQNMQSLNRYAYVFNNPVSGTDPSGFISLKEAAGGMLAAQTAVHLSMSMGIRHHMGLYVAARVANKSMEPADRYLMEHEGARQVVGVVVTAVVSYFGTPVAGAFFSAGYSSHFARVSGGSVGDIVKAGAVSLATSWAFSAVGTAFNTSTTSGFDFSSYALKTLAHGVVGGISAELQGGRFRDGFISAGVTQAFSPLLDSPALAGGDLQIPRVIIAAVIGGTASKLSGGKFANGAISAGFSYLIKSLSSVGKANSGKTSSDTTNTDENPQTRIDRLSAEVYEDFNGLPSGVKISAYPGVGIDGDINTHGEWISQNEIAIAYENRGDDWIKSIIFHELLHVDEANYVAGGSRTWWKIHEILLDGGHDNWTENAGNQYYKSLLIQGSDKPSLQDAPWRKP